jgi:PAS domain S-box-containing protein
MQTAKILVVEDDRIISRHLERLLKKLGYAVAAVTSNGPEAIALTVQCLPDLILMDIILDGEMDGIATAEQIHLLSNIPIIFLTAFAEEKVLQRARVTDPFGYILKPFEERNLHATIEMALQKHQLEMRLRETQERYLAVIEQATEGILLVETQSYRVVETNPAFLRMSNKQLADLIDQPVYLIFGVDSLQFEKTIQELRQQGHARHPDQLVRRPDGTVLFLEINLNLISYANKQLICAVVRDISQHKLAEERSQRQIERLGSLHMVEMSITAGHGLQTTLKTLLEQITGQLKVDAASVLLLDEDQVLRCAAHRGFLTPQIEKTALQTGEGYAGLAARDQRLVHASNLDNPYEREKYIPILGNEGFISYFGIPLIVKETVTGVLEVFHRSFLEASPEWLDFLNLLAGQAAIAIDNVALFEKHRDASERLALAYEATIEGWSRALELRDRETQGHSQRVTEMAIQLAGQLDLGQKEINQLRLGSLLHDIGKMGIPDAILHKPGPLTEEEWEIMRKHPLYAYNLLSPVEYLWPALEVAYSHHEHWDGSGYPRRLKGEQIPLLARIFTICDVWDSLSSRRDYRLAWDKQMIQTYIQEQSGCLFDPAIVNAFIQLKLWGKQD